MILILIVFSVVFIGHQGLGRFSFVATSAVQSAANAVQAGTKELTSKVIAQAPSI